MSPSVDKTDITVTLRILEVRLEWARKDLVKHGRIMPCTMESIQGWFSTLQIENQFLTKGL